MTPDEKMAEVVGELEAAGVRCLVMGGHAVRHYGLHRTTDDFDLHLAPECWDDITARLSGSAWWSARQPVEVPGWRTGSFRRFQVGVLPSGREEWLEFWKENHLLPPFEAVYARREPGLYGGRVCPFMALPDVIRSKETEREKDWADIDPLEEFLDARHALAVRRGEMPLPDALARLRSRRGLETHLLAGALNDPAAVAAAIAAAVTPMAVALLLPAAPTAAIPALPMEPVVVARLRAIQLGSADHRMLVEAVRRRYKQHAMQVDRADKQAVRERLNANP